MSRQQESGGKRESGRNYFEGNMSVQRRSKDCFIDIRNRDCQGRRSRFGQPGLAKRLWTKRPSGDARAERR